MMGATVSDRDKRPSRTGALRGKLRSAVGFDAREAQADGSVTAPVGTPNNPSTQILTIANVITFCRLILTGVFLWLFIHGENRALAISLYAIAAATDFLDGLVARSTQTVSWLGKVMDPVMDRVLLFVGVLGLVLTGELPLWVAVFVIGRDVYLAVGGIILQRYQRRPLDVVFIGKLTTACLMFGFCDLLLGLPEVGGLGLVDASWLPGLNAESAALGIFFVYAGVIFSTITAIVYTKEGLAIRREALSQGQAS